MAMHSWIGEKENFFEKISTRVTLLVSLLAAWMLELYADSVSLDIE